MTFVSTGQGELVSSNRGTATFSIVPKSLDFFRVRSGEALTASVHGTVFSVGASGRGVSFYCTRGAVNITRTGYLQIGFKKQSASLIDVIAAAKSARVTYRPSSDWTLARFATYPEAAAFYRHRLDVALETGDPNALSAAHRNLGVIEENSGSIRGGPRIVRPRSRAVPQTGRSRR